MRRTAPRERGSVDGRNESGWRSALASTASDRASRPMRTSVQLQSTNGRTPSKTGKYQRPESKTNQQHRDSDEICKTSTPVQIRAAPPNSREELIVCAAVAQSRARQLDPIGPRIVVIRAYSHL